MEKEYKMSQARKDELEQELNYLKTTRSDEVALCVKPFPCIVLIFKEGIPTLITRFRIIKLPDLFILQSRSKKIKKFAVISRIPTPDNTYYPIPYYPCSRPT